MKGDVFYHEEMNCIAVHQSRIARKCNLEGYPKWKKPFWSMAHYSDADGNKTLFGKDEILKKHGWSKIGRMK